jgi:hypothetical protein
MTKAKTPVVGQPGHDPTARPQSINVQEPEIERSIVKPFSLSRFADGHKTTRV